MTKDLFVLLERVFKLLSVMRAIVWFSKPAATSSFSSAERMSACSPEIPSVHIIIDCAPASAELFSEMMP